MLHMRWRRRPTPLQIPVQDGAHRREHTGHRARVHGTRRTRRTTAHTRRRSLPARTCRHVQEGRSCWPITVAFRATRRSWHSTYSTSSLFTPF